MERNHTSTIFEVAISFHLWASSLRTPPDWRRIATKFDVSRATAYRWLRAWEDTNAKFEFQHDE